MKGSWTVFPGVIRRAFLLAPDASRSDAPLACIQTASERYLRRLERFVYFWEDENTFDISQALLERLLAWLELRRPWDVYLKAASVLLSAEEAGATARKLPSAC